MPPAAPHPDHGDHPLGLTVHALPDPGQADASARTRLGRWKMLLVMLLCAAPVVASYFTYYVVRPEGRRNFGTLIEPQVAMPSWSAQALDGKEVPLASLKGQWLLVSVGGGDCRDACAHNLYLQKQLQTVLGKERDRMDRVWFVVDAQPIDAASRAATADATVLRAARGPLAAWLKPQDGHALEDHLYLVDPMGHWMLRFPPKLDLAGAGKAKRDLDRLLRASAGWDQPGREVAKP